MILSFKSKETEKLATTGGFAFAGKTETLTMWKSLTITTRR